MVSIFVHRNNQTEQDTSIDRSWLNPSAGVYVWVDLAAPLLAEQLILSETFWFHTLAVEDAISARQYPKVEAYDGCLYAVLHGINYHKVGVCFDTNDVDFFIGPTYLVTVHGHNSRSITE